MYMRWFHLVPREELMESKDGEWLGDIVSCMGTIHLLILDGLISTEDDIEAEAYEFGFDVVWWGDEK